jgi:hypothetical protein
MSPHEKPTLTSADVVKRIRSEIATSSGERTESGVGSRVAWIRALQRDFRVEPLGGRLLPVKRFLYWFVASAFDRQAKVVEALLDVVRDLSEETDQLRNEVAHLRVAAGELPSIADLSVEPEKVSQNIGDED